jgi:hypothetical protein
MAGTVGELRAAVANALPATVWGLTEEKDGLPVAPRLRVCDVWQHKVYKVYRSQEKVVEIRPTDETVVLEVSHSPQMMQQAFSSSPHSSPEKQQQRGGGGGSGSRKSLLAAAAAGGIAKNGGGKGGGGGGGVRFCDVLMARQVSNGSSGGRGRGGGSVGTSSASGFELFGAPWMISYDPSMSCGEVQRLVRHHCERFFSKQGIGGSQGGRGDGDDDDEKELFTILGTDGEGAAVSGNGGPGEGRGGANQPFWEWLDGTGEGSGGGGARNGGGGTPQKGGGGAGARALTVVFNAHLFVTQGSNGSGNGSGNGSSSSSSSHVSSSSSSRRRVMDPDAFGGWARPRADDQKEKRGGGGKDAVETVKLRECFDLFTEREQLGENDLWFCSKCKVNKWGEVNGGR